MSIHKLGTYYGKPASLVLLVEFYGKSRGLFQYECICGEKFFTMCFALSHCAKKHIGGKIEDFIKPTTLITCKQNLMNVYDDCTANITQEVEKQVQERLQAQELKHQQEICDIKTKLRLEIEEQQKETKATPLTSSETMSTTSDSSSFGSPSDTVSNCSTPQCNLELTVVSSTIYEPPKAACSTALGKRDSSAMDSLLPMDTSEPAPKRAMLVEKVHNPVTEDRQIAKLKKDNEKESDGVKTPLKLFISLEEYRERKRPQNSENSDPPVSLQCNEPKHPDIALEEKACSNSIDSDDEPPSRFECSEPRKLFVGAQGDLEQRNDKYYTGPDQIASTSHQYAENSGMKPLTDDNFWRPTQNFNSLYTGVARIHPNYAPEFSSHPAFMMANYGLQEQQAMHQFPGAPNFGQYSGRSFGHGSVDRSVPLSRLLAAPPPPPPPTEPYLPEAVPPPPVKPFAIKENKIKGNIFSPPPPQKPYSSKIDVITLSDDEEDDKDASYTEAEPSPHCSQWGSPQSSALNTHHQIDDLVPVPMEIDYSLTEAPDCESPVKIATCLDHSARVSHQKVHLINSHIE